MIFSKKEYLFFISTMIIFIFISYFTLDRSISLYFIQNADTYKEFGKFASTVGESHWYIGVALLGSLYFRFFKRDDFYMQRFLFLLYVNLFSGLISLVLKIFFARIRPWKLENGGDMFGFLISQNENFTFIENINYQITLLLQDSTHYTSFPSGHTTTIFAVFTYLSILFPKHIYLWLGLSILGASTRILANDHFLSDIFAGLLVGTISTLFIYSKMKDKLEKNV